MCLCSGSTLYFFLSLTAGIPEGSNVVTAVGPDEMPPPYHTAVQGSVPMVTCRVCQAMIDISGRRDQHVVKCTSCNEATVSMSVNFVSIPRTTNGTKLNYLNISIAANTECSTREEICAVSLQLPSHL